MVYGVFAPQTLWFDDESFNTPQQPRRRFHQPFHHGNHYSNYESYPDDDDYCIDCQPGDDFWQPIPIIRQNERPRTSQRNLRPNEAPFMMPKRQQVDPSNRVLRPRKSKLTSNRLGETCGQVEKRNKNHDYKEVNAENIKENCMPSEETKEDTNSSSTNIDAKENVENNSNVEEQNVEKQTVEEVALETSIEGEDGQSEDNSSSIVEERIHKIDGIVGEVNELSNKMNKCIKEAKLSMKDYAFYEEMLTKCLLKLDSILTDGIDDIRLHRKKAVELIEKTLNTLEKPES